MSTETILGIGSVIVLVGFVWFAFRKGEQVKNKGDGAPGEAQGPPPDSPVH